MAADFRELILTDNDPTNMACKPERVSNEKWLNAYRDPVRASDQPRDLPSSILKPLMAGRGPCYNISGDDLRSFAFNPRTILTYREATIIVALG